MDILCNYQGYQGCRLILVYDAYKVKGNPGSVMKYHNIEVVYTKEAETADQYIERTTHEAGSKTAEIPRDGSYLRCPGADDHLGQRCSQNVCPGVKSSGGIRRSRIF